jgi:uncharacterized protein (TIGR02453 family)
MPATYHLKPVLSFLDDLSRHNDKTWFDENRPAYESARKQYELFIGELIDELRASDQLGGLSARDCIARIYRDVRFSRDKSPYKIYMGAMIAPGGWGAGWLGYYISLQPGGESMVAGGLYKPEPEPLNRFRRAVDRDAAALMEIINQQEFVKTFGNIEGERLKTAPRGYDPAHAQIDLLRLKQITAIHRFSDEAVLADDFSQQVLAGCQTLKPFLSYLAGVL